MTGQHLMVPRRFALVRHPDDDDAPVITGWGIELPDGSALSVSTDDQAVAVCSRAIHCELLHSTTLAWIDGDAGDLEEEKPS